MTQTNDMGNRAVVDPALVQQRWGWTNISLHLFRHNVLSFIYYTNFPHTIFVYIRCLILLYCISLPFCPHHHRKSTHPTHPPTYDTSDVQSERRATIPTSSKDTLSIVTQLCVSALPAISEDERSSFRLWCGKTTMLCGPQRVRIERVGGPRHRGMATGGVHDAIKYSHTT